MARTHRDDVEELYHSCLAQFGPALNRLASAYEADFDLRRDLLQEIHTSLWRSLGVFDGLCSLRTWMFRVAHNTAATHVTRNMRQSREWVSLETVADLPGQWDHEATTNRKLVIDRVMALTQTLRPLDRQMFLLYLEGLDSASIAEVIGISISSVTTKIHRIKRILVKQFHEGDTDAHRSGRRRGPEEMAESGARDEPVDGEPASPHRAPVR
jgi:RNA polymerase sigma-70 factor (ECF subfamily)